MVVISSVVSVVSFLALGLLAEHIVLSIARSLCLYFDFDWFPLTLLLAILVDSGFPSVSCVPLPLNARDPADSAVFAIFPIPIFCTISPQYSFSSLILRSFS